MNPISIIKDGLDEGGLWENEITYSRGAVVFRAGQIHTTVYFVVEGSLRVYRVSGDEEQTVRFGYKDNLITALDSFITGQHTTFYMEAIKKTKVLTIGKNRLIQFIQSKESLMALWNDMLEILILQQMERENDLLTVSPAERYQRVLERSPQLFQEIPSKYIASYLRMTPETLSRLKKS